MKLNFYSYLVFGLIFIFLYPLIFYFSDKRINNNNNNLVTYEYSLRGILSLDNIPSMAAYAVNQAEIINSKYFDDKPIFKFQPKEKFTVSETYNLSAIERDINLLFDSDMNLLPTNNLTVIKNNELILILGESVIFYYDLNNIFNFIREEMARAIDLKNKNNTDCDLIEQTLLSMKKINYSIFEFHFIVSQKINSSDGIIKEKKDVMPIYKNCLVDRFNIIKTNLKNHIINLEKLQISDFENNYLNFVNNEKEFILENNDIRKLRKNIFEVKNEIIKSLININFNLQVLEPVEIEIYKNYQKNFNMYVVSFILSILLTLIIFYALFFLKNQVKILKKIF